MTPSDEQVGRLPKWARAYIEGLERRIDGGVDISAGGVNYVTLTRAEQKKPTWPRHTVPIEVWQRLVRGKP